MDIKRQPANAPPHALDPEKFPDCYIYGSGKKLRVQLLMELKEWFSSDLSWPTLEASTTDHIAWNEKFETVCKVHGPIEPRTPMRMFQTTGCPKCANKNITEELFIRMLIDVGLVIEEQFSPTWAGNKRYDAHLSEHNILIELHGQQHYQYVKHFHRTEQGYVDSFQKDRLKRELAVENGMIQIDVSQEYFYCTHTEKRRQKMIDDLVRLINVLVKFNAPPQHIVYTPEWIM